MSKDSSALPRWRIGRQPLLKTLLAKILVVHGTHDPRLEELHLEDLRPHTIAPPGIRSRIPALLPRESTARLSRVFNCARLLVSSDDHVPVISRDCKRSVTAENCGSLTAGAAPNTLALQLHAESASDEKALADGMALFTSAVTP